MAQFSFCMRKVFQHMWRTQHASRLLSTTASSSQLVNLNVGDNGVAVLRMNNKPVNSLSLELMTELSIAFDKVDADKSCHGLIITSDLPRVFCAGLDLKELHEPQVDRLGAYWQQFQEMWIRLYGLRVPAIAAINGNSPAAGCVIGMACDYRIMAQGNYSIGLTTTRLGVVAPYWVKDMMVATVGQRHAERGLQLGLVWPVEEALKIGLIDEIVPEKDVVNRAQAVIKDWIAVPDAARHITKLALRQPAITKLRGRQQDDLLNFSTYVMQDWVQQNLKAFMESMKKKSSSK